MHHTKYEQMEMNKNLHKIPTGNDNITILNVAYNNIEELPSLIFYNNSYKNVRKLLLQNNRINNISDDAFRGLDELKTIDCSDNKITTLDPYVFKHNNKLDKVILINNHIKFHRLQPFLMSRTIDTLILTSNNITEIYEITFLGLPNIKRLFLNENNLKVISSYSFARLKNFNYLSLANTLIYELKEDMFNEIPTTIDLEGTPLSRTFNPPLDKVKGISVLQLLATLRKF